jgi:C4-dicarboxylate transporter
MALKSCLLALGVVSSLAATLAPVRAEEIVVSGTAPMSPAF